MITCTGSFISLQDIDEHFVFVQNVYTMYFVHVHVVYTNCTGQTKIDICTCKIIFTFKQVEHAVQCVVLLSNVNWWCLFYMYM